MLRGQNFRLRGQDSPNSMEKICSCDKEAVKQLIEAENSENRLLRTLLCLINMKGLEPESRSDRRRINKFFCDCLVEVVGGRNLALLWLKRHIAFDICSTIRSDWSYQGKLMQKLRLL